MATIQLDDDWRLNTVRVRKRTVHVYSPLPTYILRIVTHLEDVRMRNVPTERSNPNRIIRRVELARTLGVDYSATYHFQRTSKHPDRPLPAPIKVSSGIVGWPLCWLPNDWQPLFMDAPYPQKEAPRPKAEDPEIAAGAGA